ncbi:MAG: 7,8-didemethyl-8-hydroxy-5-deazariboflavin synthase subunit CofG [Cyanobacteria bacterium P01_C01_bin.120]
MLTLSATNTVTYSPALTIVPTYECFNCCTYCNFRVAPQQDQWLSLAALLQQLMQARSHGIIEILVLSGEVHPASQRRTVWFQHVLQLCQTILQQGFLPHTNVGLVSEAEMARLKAVNASMGLMLEQITPKLLESVHRYAPSKVPEKRLAQLEQAGRLQIPFTTGLLLGIGESDSDRLDTLQTIARCHDRWGHIQEVILQPHQPGSRQARAAASFSPSALANFVKVARQNLPKEIAIQIPPNLVGDRRYILEAIANGATDLGGLGPKDEVNPDYEHPTPSSLRQLLETHDRNLQPRLPVYPQYDDWLSPKVQSVVKEWRDRLKNYVKNEGQASCLRSGTSG